MSDASPKESHAWPFVSVVMPIRNEAGYIEQGIAALGQQDYPSDRFEIIIADGMSDDGTREILERLVKQNSKLVVIDNPQRIVSTGLNAAIEQAQGEIILRLDGHAEIADDFIRQNVLLLAEHPEAWIVGGPIVHVGRNLFAKAVAVARSSRFGVGNASHRFPDFEGYAEGCAFPAIRRWVFDRVGNFDEMLVRNQDDEFNYRVTQAGGKVYISPRVRYEYFVRDTPRKLFRQYFQYSFWRIPVIRKHKRPTTLRQIVPSLFFLVMFVVFVAGLAMRQPLVAIALPCAYVLALIAIALPYIPREGLGVALRVPFAIGTLQLAYAWGMVYGLLCTFLRPKAWQPTGRMTALSR